MDRDAFISMMMPYAQQASSQTGLDPRLIIAQSALETGWGRSAPGMNYFGIKSHGRSGGQSLPTTEVYNGQPVGIIDSFRTYGNPGESVSDYVDFLRTNPRYEPLLAAEGLDAQLSALGASGYATDPQYESKLRSIAQGIEVGPMRTDELIANAGGAIDRAEAPSPLSRMANLFSTRSEPAASGGAGGMAYSSGGLVPGLMYLSGKAGDGLSRDQRRMLGFAALADAGAALSGRQGGQTQALMGQMQADQERERLRRQGLLQNLVALQEATASYRLMNLPIPEFLQRMQADIMSQIGGAGGMPMPQAAPATGGIPAAGVSAAPPVAETMLPATGAPEPVTGLDALSNEELRQRAQAAAASGNDAAARTLMAEAERRAAAAETQKTTASEVGDIDYRVNIIDQVLDSPNLAGVVGRIEGGVDPDSASGAALFNEGEQEVLALLEQIGGANFLQAFESLKGGGQITEIEGAKAEAAISRIGNRRMGVEGMTRALEELRQIYANARARKLGQEVPYPNVGAIEQQDDRSVDDLLRQYGG